MKDETIGKVTTGKSVKRILLTKREIREIRDESIKIPETVIGLPVHTYHAEHAYSAGLALVIYVLMLMSADVLKLLSPEVLRPGILGGAVIAIVLITYFSINDAILSLRIRRMGQFENTDFWISVLHRRGFL